MTSRSSGSQPPNSRNKQSAIVIQLLLMAKELLKYQCNEGFLSNTRVHQMPVLQQWTQPQILQEKTLGLCSNCSNLMLAQFFLFTSLKLWSEKSDYLKVKAIIKVIPVVNDASE